MDLSEINFAVLVASLIVASTPLVLAALGELIVEKSGVLNLGVEGMMIIGAVTGFIVGVETGSAYIGMMAAAMAGALLSLLFAFIILIIKFANFCGILCYKSDFFHIFFCSIMYFNIRWCR